MRTYPALIVLVALALFATGCAADIGGFSDPGLGRQALTFEFFYALAGLVVGTLSIGLGVILLVRGLVGAESWTARVFGLELQFLDAPVGVFLIVAGVAIVFITRFRASVRAGATQPRDGADSTRIDQ